MIFLYTNDRCERGSDLPESHHSKTPLPHADRRTSPRMRQWPAWDQTDRSLQEEPLGGHTANDAPPQRRASLHETKSPGETRRSAKRSPVQAQRRYVRLTKWEPRAAPSI